MEGIPIRAARRGDIPSLLLLWTAMMEENARLDPRLALHHDAKEHMAARFASWLQDPERAVVVAEEGGRLVLGYAAARIAPGTGWHRPEKLGEVTDCFVIPARRRRGLARRMVGRLTDLLYERGVDTVRLQVAVDNEGTLAFWKAIGWEVLEEVLEWEGGAPRTGASPP
ncbi:MAG: GNAT family N-acetyltransferase [Planctomycetota bacterium]